MFLLSRTVLGSEGAWTIIRTAYSVDKTALVNEDNDLTQDHTEIHQLCLSGLFVIQIDTFLPDSL